MRIIQLHKNNDSNKGCICCAFTDKLSHLNFAKALKNEKRTINLKMPAPIFLIQIRKYVCIPNKNRFYLSKMLFLHLNKI